MGIEFNWISQPDIKLYGNTELIISITRGKSSAPREPSHQDGVQIFENLTFTQIGWQFISY